MDETPQQGTQRPVTERAERVLDRFTQRLNEARRQMAARAAAANGRSQEPPLQRAESLADQAGERVGRFAGRATYEMRRFLARAREGFEDAWAEAQSRRGNDTPPQ